MRVLWMTAKGSMRKTHKINQQDNWWEFLIASRWEGWVRELNIANTRGVYCIENWPRQNHEENERRACHLRNQ